MTLPVDYKGVTILTGGSDRSYVFGLATSLGVRGAEVELIGSDELDTPEFRTMHHVTFLNLRGDQLASAGLLRKMARVSTYYWKLVRYAAAARPKVFHVLWNNRFEYFDRTALMLYYKLLGKKIVLTAHNVNARKRDCCDSVWNRATLRIQYRVADHVFVHTEKMKNELLQDFGARRSAVTVIPFGINNSVPVTSLPARTAKEWLGLGAADKAVLFFGRITPYKGLDILVAALRLLWGRDRAYRLIIAGRPDNCEQYWGQLKAEIDGEVERRQILLRAEFIPDSETEIYFKAADTVVLPYRNIYQSGVLFLGHSFGLPVLAADVGSFGDDIVEGKTGCIFRPEDPVDLARSIELYFASELYQNLDDRRPEIREYSTARHSWEVVAQMTTDVYSNLLAHPARRTLAADEGTSTS